MATIDGRALAQIEDTLHVELVPGTEVMTDGRSTKDLFDFEELISHSNIVGGIHFKHSSAHGHRVLVPQPSSDPNDPLNWSRTWKGLAMVGMALSSFANGFGPLSEAPQLPAYIAEWNITLEQAVDTVSILSLHIIRLRRSIET